LGKVQRLALSLFPGELMKKSEVTFAPSLCIFEVRTQREDALSMRFFDTYRVSAKDAVEAANKVTSNKAQRLCGKDERVMQVTLLAQED
jgi:hypothetical protein